MFRFISFDFRRKTFEVFCREREVFLPVNGDGYLLRPSRVGRTLGSEGGLYAEYEGLPHSLYLLYYIKPVLGDSAAQLGYFCVDRGNGIVYRLTAIPIPTNVHMSFIADATESVEAFEFVLRKFNEVVVPEQYINELYKEVNSDGKLRSRAG